MSALRALLRSTLPLNARIAIRRAPAAAMYLLRPLPERRPPSSRADFPHSQAERSTPLARSTALYDAGVQAAKERNVRLAAALVDGAVVAPGETFSWHRFVGPPWRRRGFEDGPELREEKLTQGEGGGLCQVANLVYWLALHAGMRIVERHRHALDLFPDHERSAPFGCGATVFYPHRDLRFVNPLDQSLLLELSVSEGLLTGHARLQRDPGVRFEVVEREHRFVRRAGLVWRENTLHRLARGTGLAREELIAKNSARVLYEVDASLLEEP